MLLVALVPIILALPQLTPWLIADPVYYTANMSFDQGSAIQRGVPYVDVNNGYQTQALGYRAARDWLDGEVPWWNPYSGVGMPLAGEYQPSAFFPLTFLLLLPRGMVLLQMALEILAGLGTYALLRQLGMGRLAAITGGIVYGVNGTFAVFAHGPASPVPFLPWFLYGIERAAIAASERSRGGWRTVGWAMGLSLLAGFPETAYISGVLALAWTVLRGVQLEREARKGFAIKITVGGACALAIASPQIVSFLQFLPLAHVGGHDGSWARVAMGGTQAVASLVAPYVMGPLMAYGFKWDAVTGHWSTLGGFVTLPLLTMAIYGLAANRSAVAILLAGWFLAALGKSFGVEPFMSLWNLVPGITTSHFFRYAQPSWELAFVLLAMFGLDQLQRTSWQRVPAAVAFVTALLLAGWSAGLMATLWPQVRQAGSLAAWVIVSLIWAVLTTAAMLAFMSRRSPRAAAVLLAIDAALMCAIPIASNPRSGRLDMAAVEFLQRNLGLQRFYAFDLIQPNYSAYFGIAAITHNYLPVPHLWVDHIHANLDRKWTDGTVFNGDSSRNSPEEFRANYREFEKVGVKYVVMHPDQDHTAGIPGVRQVYADTIMKIVELPNPAPYFESAAGHCKVDAIERRSAHLECAAPDVLVRHELHFPGWRATVNGSETPVIGYEPIFQSVAVPAGASEVKFRYAPPHVGWAWLAFWIGLAGLCLPRSLVPRRKHQ